MPMRAPHVHVMGRGTMARGHHTSLNVLWLHAVEKAVSTGAAARLLREDEGEKEGKQRDVSNFLINVYNIDFFSIP